MDREVLKMIAHIDQTRATVSGAIERMDADDLIELFRDCAAGRLDSLDEPARQLAGLLAAMAIYDLCEHRDSNNEAEPGCEHAAPEDACPNCGERESDELVWLDDERVQCQKCGTTYQPGGKRNDSDA